MHNRISILFSVLLFAAATAIAQDQCTGSFSGHVKSEAGEPLPGATIILSPGSAGQVCDSEGHFHFTSLCNGDYQVTIQYLGYETSSIKLQFTGNMNKEFRLQPSSKELEEVLIVGKHEHTDNAQNLSVINESKLAESAGKSLGETLKEVPGVSTIQSGPGIFKPVIHGVHSQRVLILNHGIRQEGQQWGAEHAPEIDPFVASELVVIKDASAIKYGSDALGGVIVVNPPPLPEQEGIGGSLNTVVQSNGMATTVSGAVEGGLKNHKGWGWRVQGTGKRAGDHKTPDYLLANTGIRELDFSSAVGYHHDKWGTEVFYSHFNTEIGILKGTAVATHDDLIDAMEREVPLYTTNDFTYRIGAPRQRATHNLLKLNGHVDANKGEWHFQYGFQQNKRREYDVRSLGVSSSVPAIDLDLTSHSGEIEWETSPNDNRNWCFGINTMIQDNDNVPGTMRLPFVPNFTSFFGGPFAVGKFAVGKWTWDAGLRYDYRHYAVAGRDFKNDLYHAKLDFANVSATLGGTWQKNAGQSLSLNLSSAWRPPHVTELYSFGTHQSAASKEYGLLIDDSTNDVISAHENPIAVEQALKTVLTYRIQKELVQFEASGYSNLIFNYIYLKPSGVTQDLRGAGIYFRYGQTDALFIGADISATWSVTRHLKVSPKVSYLRASDVRNDDYLPFIPSNRAEIGVRYESDEGKPLTFYVESDLKYVARQFRAPAVVTPRQLAEEPSTAGSFDFMSPPDKYFLWNLGVGASHAVGQNRLDLRITCENILNTVYREYTNRYKYFADDLGRNISASLKFIF